MVRNFYTLKNHFLKFLPQFFDNSYYSIKICILLNPIYSLRKHPQSLYLVNFTHFPFFVIIFSFTFIFMNSLNKIINKIK